MSEECIRSARRCVPISIISVGGIARDLPLAFPQEKECDICIDEVGYISFNVTKVVFGCVCGCVESDARITVENIYSYDWFEPRFCPPFKRDLKPTITASVYNATYTVDTFYGIEFGHVPCRSVELQDITIGNYCSIDNMIYSRPFRTVLCRGETISYGESVFFIPYYYLDNMSGAIRTEGVYFYLNLYIVTANEFLTQIILNNYYLEGMIDVCVREYIEDRALQANTKEDYEVLKGLWEGRYAYEEHHDAHIIKNAKVVDLI